MSESEDTFRKIIELNPEDASAYYNLGMVLAQDSTRLSEAETAYRKAIEYLRQAARDENFNRHWARNDPDLSSIRNDPRFDEIVDKL